MTVVLDPFAAAIAGASVFVAGALFEHFRAHREATKSTICPTCFGPTDEKGGSEGWSE